MTVLTQGNTLTYRIYPNRGPGLYFFPSSFDSASILDWLLPNSMVIVSDT